MGNDERRGSEKTVLIWQGEGGFAGEDLHRLAHRRVGPMLRRRLGDRAPAVRHRRGPISQALDLCAAQASRPAVLVLPAFRTQLWRSLDAIEELARRAPDLPVLLSGWGASPDYLDAIGRPLRHPRLALVRGEPEEGLVDALEVLIANPDGELPRRRLAELGLAIPAPDGGGWERRGRHRQVSRLEDLPSVYGSGAMRPDETDGVALIEVARGCRFRCGFCLSCNFDPPGIRPFPFEVIAAEIRHAAAQGAVGFALLCSALNYDVTLFEQLADLLDHLGGPAAVESTVHALQLDRRRLAALKRIRWRRMIIGLQTLTPEALEMMGRAVDRARFRRAIDQIATIHVPVVELILGLPGDTLKSFLRTVRWVLDLPVHVEIYHLRLDPGSRFFEQRGELGLEADFSSQGKVTSTPTFPASDLERAVQALEHLAAQPWRFRARSLGFDFRTLARPEQARRAKPPRS